jgi:ribosome biogenesis protein ERB1
MAPLAPHRKRKQPIKEKSSDGSDSEHFPDGGLDLLSGDEDEDGPVQESDSDGVDAFPEIDAGSDTDEESEQSPGDDEDRSESEEEGQDDEDALSDDDLHIFPKAKTVISDITGHPKKVYPEIEPDYDSDSSTEDVRAFLMSIVFTDLIIHYFKAPNRVGNVPLHWYDDLPHIGYDVDGKKVLKPARGDELDKFLKTVDDPSAW